MLGRKYISLSKRLQSFFWPRGGFRRAWKYVVVRMHRLNASPHKVAAGFAAGAAVSFTPLVGLHIVLGMLVALLTRGSLIAAALGTLIGNPFTFPFMFASSYWVGDMYLSLASADMEDVLDVAVESLDETSGEEAEAAADAVLDVAADALSDGNVWSHLESIKSIFFTMLIGSIPLVVVAFGCFYVLIRVIMAALKGRPHPRRLSPARNGDAG